MNQLKKGTRVLVKGKSESYKVTTGEIHSRQRITVTSESGKRIQVSVRSLKVLSPSQLGIINKYMKLMSW